jgi:hypothetical protein
MGSTGNAVERFRWKQGSIGGVVLHACNPSNLGDWGWKITSSRPTWAGLQGFVKKKRGQREREREREGRKEGEKEREKERDYGSTK